MVKQIFNNETYPSSPEQLAQGELDAFLNNPGLSELSQLFGLEELPADQHDRLQALQGIAEAHWDFRKGAERQATDWDDELLDQPGSMQWNTIFTAADKLGLVRDSEPANKQPDLLVILGGANRAPLDRLRYGLSKVDDFGTLIYLGSSRELPEPEKQKVADYAPNAQTEFDLGCGAFESLLKANLVDGITIDSKGSTYEVYTYEFELNGKMRKGIVMSTPQTIGTKRATTYDNYRFLAEREELDINPSKTIVSVTTGQFRLGQHLPAVQELTLNYGTTVETIGHSAEYSGVTRKPSQLLMETKSAIDAAARLEQAIKQNLDTPLNIAA